MSTLSFSSIISHTFVSHPIYYTLSCSPLTIHVHNFTIYQDALYVWLNVHQKISLNRNNEKNAFKMAIMYFSYFLRQ